LILGTLVLAAGCGGSTATATTAGGGGTSSSSGANVGSTTGSSGPSSSSGNSKGEAYTAKFDAITVKPGQERTQCVVRRLGNKSAISVGNIHNQLSSASHHLIVYKTGDKEEKVTPFDCQPFSDLLKPEKGAPLMITQKHDELLALPKGVAFAFGADQFVRLEMHYINTTQADITASATSTFYAMPEAEVTATADLLFVGNPDIDIPPQQKKTLGPTYLPLPAQVGDAKFFGITGHTHQYGTKVWVGTSAMKLGAVTPVYDVPNWLWSEPATVYFDPPFQVAKGGGFQFTCEWNNTSNKKVTFGESANQEMCFFWAYYYPSKGAFVCAHTDQIPGGYNMCCPGDAFCNTLFN
jgi:hypothetical protein